MSTTNKERKSMGKYLTFVKGFFSSRFLVICLLLCSCLLLVSVNASAQMTNSNVFSDILQRYQSVASAWSTTITKHATWLFWCLVSISMIWTFGMMALRKADFGEFFAEFVRFTIFTGFFWWLLSNGPYYANTIIQIASTNCQRGNRVRTAGDTQVTLQT